MRPGLALALGRGRLNLKTRESCQSRRARSAQCLLPPVCPPGGFCVVIIIISPAPTHPPWICELVVCHALVYMYIISIHDTCTRVWTPLSRLARLSLAAASSFLAWSRALSGFLNSSCLVRSHPDLHWVGVFGSWGRTRAQGGWQGGARRRQTSPSPWAGFSLPQTPCCGVRRAIV